MEVVHAVESIEELGEDLLFSFSSGLDIRVSASVVNIDKIFDGNISRDVLVELGESLEDEVLSEVVHLTTDGVDELIEVDEAVLSAIEVLKESGNFVILKSGAEVSHSFSELILIKRSAVVVVSNLNGKYKNQMRVTKIL